MKLVDSLLKNTRNTGTPRPPRATHSSPVRRHGLLPFALLPNTRKTGTPRPPRATHSSPVRRHGLLPFALLPNTRNTGTVSAAPPKGLATSFSRWRRAAAPFGFASILFLLAGGVQAQSRAEPESVVVPKLKGLVFVAKPDAIQKERRRVIGCFL